MAYDDAVKRQRCLSLSYNSGKSSTRSREGRGEKQRRGAAEAGAKIQIVIPAKAGTQPPRKRGVAREELYGYYNAFRRNPLVLHNFAGPKGDGQIPQAPLLMMQHGSLYGVTLGGGAHSGGTAFKWKR
jgi:hypothetical protein